MAKSAERLIVRMLKDEEQVILVVDDSEDDTLLLRLAFQKAEFHATVRSVGDGEDAIAYFEGRFPYNDRTVYPRPTLVLLDLNMPRKGGFEVMEWIRAQPELRHLPVIVLTSSMRAGDVEQAFDFGATSFFVKPTRMEELITMVRCLRDWLHFSHFPRGSRAARARDPQEAALSFR